MRSFPWLFVVLAVGCGGVSSIPTEHTETCSGTCDEINLTGPVVAALNGDGRVSVVARGESGDLLYGSTEITNGQWDSEGLHFRTIASFPSEPATLVGGLKPFLAAASGGRVVISEVAPNGVQELVSIDAPDVERITLVDGWVAWTQSSASPVIARWGDNEVTTITTPLAKSSGWLALVNSGEEAFVAHRTSAGIELLRIGEATPMRITGGETESHTLFLVGDTVWVAWADRQGVWARTFSAGQLGTTRHVDDGEVAGEPAHRIGAGITGGVVGGVPLLAYQDQTIGALVTTRLARRTMNQLHPSRDFSRGYHISMVPVGERLLVIDCAFRVDRGLNGTFFAGVY